MQDKVIFLNIGPRRKRLKTKTTDEVSDLRAIHISFSDACQKDEILEKMTQNKFVVFQLKDSNDRLYDLEEEDEIEDGCDVFAVFVEKPSESSIVNTFDIPVLIKDKSQAVKSDEVPFVFLIQLVVYNVLLLFIKNKL